MEKSKPFLAVIWFHTPHLPVVTGPKYRKMYTQYSEDEQHFIEGKMTKRHVPIGFESSKQVSLTDNRHKIYSNDGGKTYMLFDLIEDPGESRDIAAEKPQILEAMKAEVGKWRRSCRDR
ncbi:MAG: hypothetical protein ISS70_16370 [Phycisphaerae bacterium]|nr:hypothetical protein [Phycisphaerae bacterium]